MSAAGMTEGRLALAKSDIRLALEDLDSLRARVCGSGFGDDEWDGYVETRFKAIASLLREALEALR